MATKPRTRFDDRYCAVPAPGLLLAWMLFGLGLAPALADDPPRRILLLEGQSATQPGGVATFEAFKRRLRERSLENYEVDFDHLDLARFPGEAHAERAARFLGQKHAQRPLDLVVPNGRGSLSVVSRYRDLIAPDIPIVYCCVSRATADALNLPGDAIGVLTEHNWSQTLGLAERLQPDARNLVLVSGASDVDRAWQADVRKAIGPHLDRYRVRYLAGLPRDDLIAELSRLSRDTIVLLTVVFADRNGRAYVPAEVARDVAAASAAPVYTSVPGWLGGGVVGGYMDSFEAQGAAAADLALEILSGKDPATLPRQTKPSHTYQIDARQLVRWGLAESNLPSDAVVLFREPTLWEQHRNLVLAAIAAFGLQTAVVVALLIQTRKRRSAEVSLKDSEDRMAFAAASTNTGIWQLDVAAERVWATEHCRSMLGLAGDIPITIETLLNAVHPEDRCALADSVKSAVQFGLPVNGEFRVALPDRATRWFVAKARPRFDDDGKPVRISGIFADVTERKAAEAEADLQRMELAHLMRVSVLGELSGAIAHELNQPLTAILANAQAARLMIAEKSPDLGIITEVLDDIVQEDNRAGEVIHRLRGLLRKGESKYGPVDINDLVQSTLRLLHSELIGRRIRVDLALADRLPLASGDAVQLQQVLLNLVMNAMDAMSATVPPRRLITIRTQAGTDGHVAAVVADCGRGIAAVAKDRLFQPFFTTKDHGLGLGLSICATIVKSHGGTLSLDNNADGGATAMLTLPAVAVMATAS